MPLTDRGYPYPGMSDATQVPVDLQALAQAVNTDVQGIDDRKLTQAVYVVQASAGLVTVANATERLVGNYDTVPAFETDPSALISFASGVFTLGAPGMWGWAGTVAWPAVDSSAVKHTRQLYVVRNGAFGEGTRSGRSALPVAAGAWDAFTQSTEGNVITTDSSSTLQLAAYADPGVGTLTCAAVVFAVWLTALAD